MSFKAIIAVVVIWGICCSVLPKEEPKGVFALKIGIQGDGSLYTLYGFINNGRTLTHQRILTNQEFVRFASGFWPSIYNPEKINFFKLNNIDCGIVNDVNNVTNHTFCVPLDSVWKLKYIYFPFSNNPETGWAKGSYGPSEKQFNYLKENYNLVSFENSYFKDEFLWKLFIDIQKQDWINNYKSLN
jgi:hypothetical protein